MAGIKAFNEKDILYLDQDLIVVHKRAGMAVQSKSAGQMDLEHALLNMLARREKSAKRQIPYLAVVHRLDQPVEGVIVFARTREAAAGLSAQLGSEQMKKEYLALVHPAPVREQGELTDYLLKDAKTNTSSVVPAGTAGAKKAVLLYKIREMQTDHALLEVHLKTGRHHQIRVQLAHMGSPIVGDSKYGSGEVIGRGLIALCAFRLSFRHPGTGKQMKFELEPESEAFARRI